MSLPYLLTGIVAVLLCLYLVYTIIRPDKF